MRKTYNEIIEDLIKNSGTIVERAKFIKVLKNYPQGSIRSAIDLTLKRKCEEGELERIGYGLYKKIKQ